MTGAPMRAHRRACHQRRDLGGFDTMAQRGGYCPHPDRCVVERFYAKPQARENLFSALSHELDIRSERNIKYIVREHKILIPEKLRSRSLHLAHRGHPGIVRMKQKLRETYWWPGIDNDTEEVVRHCQGCQLSEKSMHKHDKSADISVPITRS